jgi:hypothetical protein
VNYSRYPSSACLPLAGFGWSHGSFGQILADRIRVVVRAKNLEQGRAAEKLAALFAFALYLSSLWGTRVEVRPC